MAGLFALSTVAGVAVTMQPQEVYAAGQTCTWTGAGANKNFSTADNWSNCGGAAPTAGDTIRFDRQEAFESDENLVNDLGVALGGVVVKRYDSGGSWAGSGYIIDQLTLVDGAQISKELETPESSRGVGVFVSVINGQGSLTDEGAFSVNRCDDTDCNIYPKYDVAGVITRKAGAFLVDSSSRAQALVMASYAAVSGVGGGAGASISDFDYGSLTVQKGNSVALQSSYSKPITLGGGSGDDPRVVFYPGYDNDYNSVTSTYAWTSPVTLLSNASVHVREKTTVNFTGTLTGAGFKLTKDETSDGTFNSNPTSNNSSSETGTLENKTKETRLEGNVAGSVIVVNKETAILFGTRDYLSVLKGGVLKGTGTIANSLWVEAGATVAPGLSPGCLTTGALDLSGTYQVELGGTTACSGYDQIKVTGMNVAWDYDAVSIREDAVISLFGYGDFTQKEGDTFTIIDNQTDQDTKGIFKGLPEGAEVKVGGAVFTISYKGGDGNDVVLTAQNSAKLPGVPNTGIAQIISANPVVVAVMGVLTAGVLMLVRRKARQ